MKVIETELPGVLFIEPDVFEDDRGYFFESYNRQRYFERGMELELVQDNHSRSFTNVIKGLHFQSGAGQAKLVRCTRGKVFNVAVDLRKGSSSLGKWTGAELSEENRRQMFVPGGFATGYATLEPINDVLIKCGAYYNPRSEFGIVYNDPDIGVKWPLTDPVVSERDRKNMSFKEYLGRF